MSDILFRTDSYIFSYRTAGILVHEGRVLLQKPADSDAYAFPGGHVSFGETTAETLTREFKEEVGVDIEVGGLKWVEENLFRWSDKPCHQVSLSHSVKLTNPEQIPFNERFISKEHMKVAADAIYFYWIPLDEVKNLNVYPADAASLLLCLNEGVKHFIYREEL